MILPESYYKETFKGKPAFFKEHVDGGPHKLQDEEKLRIEMAQYYTMISAVDKACGQIIDIYKEKGLWDNTIVLFFTDHGDMMGAHRIRRKGTMPYEELYNIPCIMKLPKGVDSKRKVIEEPIISTDLGGALLDLAGIETPKPFNQNKISSAFQKDAPSGDEYVFFEHYAAWWGRHPFYGIRTSNLKYVRYYGEDNTEEMYDLENDPNELNNIVNDEQYSQIKLDLSQKADDWWNSTNGKNVEYYESEEFKNNIN
jgi:arylsulfatase